MSGITKLMTAGGGGVSLTPASSIASDVTVNVPSVNGTLVSTGSTAQVSQAMLASGVAGNGPAFRAHSNASQSVTSGTWTKVALQVEDYDTAGCFDNVTNYRFTPNVAGYYIVSGSIYHNFGGSNGQAVKTAIYKNGSEYAEAANSLNSAQGPWGSINVTDTIYLNGSTDYIELYGFNNNASPTFDIYGIAVAGTRFSAALVRAA